MARRRRSWGSIRKLPSGRFQARYVGPDGATYTAPETFDAKTDADAWLSGERHAIATGIWGQKPRSELPTIASYVHSWIGSRTTRTGEPLRPKTRQQYEMLYERHIRSDEIGALRLDEVRVSDVRTWWNALPVNRPTWRAHAYRLLRAALNTAVDDELIRDSPCRIRGAGSSQRKREVRPASVAELDAIVDNMPDRYKAAVLVAAWCAIRFGELVELRRSDVDLKNGRIHVRRAAVRTGGRVVVGPPKTAAGIRTVNVPPHVLPVLREHLHQRITGSNGLVFPAADGISHLDRSTIGRYFKRARAVAGRPDLRWHDLRHTGAVLAAQAGATLAELQSRLGHATPAAALIYQHAADGRDAEIARRLSEIARSASPVAHG